MASSRFAPPPTSSSSFSTSATLHQRDPRSALFDTYNSNSTSSSSTDSNRQRNLPSSSKSPSRYNGGNSNDNRSPGNNNSGGGSVGNNSPYGYRGTSSFGPGPGPSGGFVGGSVAGVEGGVGYGPGAGAGQYQQQQGGQGEGGYTGFRAATPNSRGQYSDAVLSALEDQNDTALQGMSVKVRQLKDITLSIGDEIRASSNLADTMNDGFENTRVRLRGTMNRMLRMADKTGVGWRVWVLFFLAVWGVFAWVWLF